MITEERLKELIEQKAVIYAIKDNKYIYTIGLNQELDVVNWFSSGEYKLCVVEENGAVVCDIANIEELFETKEEAEWQLEFGNITRTETLKLPLYEQVRTDKKLADNSSFNFTTHSHPEALSIYDKNKGGLVFCELLNKENYIEACRLAKKLFLEGSDDIE